MPLTATNNDQQNQQPTQDELAAAAAAQQQQETAPTKERKARTPKVTDSTDPEAGTGVVRDGKYIVGHHETLGEIAAKLGVSQKSLQAANRGRDRGLAVILTGDTLNLPTDKSAPDVPQSR